MQTREVAPHTFEALKSKQINKVQLFIEPKIGSAIEFKANNEILSMYVKGVEIIPAGYVVNVDFVDGSDAY